MSQVVQRQGDAAFIPKLPLESKAFFIVCARPFVLTAVLRDSSQVMQDHSNPRLMACLTPQRQRFLVEPGGLGVVSACESDVAQVVERGRDGLPILAIARDGEAL